MTGHTEQEHEFHFETKDWSSTLPIHQLPSLTWRLLKALISGGIVWAIMLIRFVIHGTCVAPYVARILYRYFTDPSLVRNVQYGPNGRNFLDIYLTDKSEFKNPRPVMILVSGGAWIISHKAWVAWWAFILQKLGVVCISVDYRNFPQANVDGMVEDIDCAVKWVLQNISEFGGDPSKVHISGQSAGAHLIQTWWMNVVSNALQNSKDLNAIPPIKSIIGVSGPYDIVGSIGYFISKGIHRKLLLGIFDGPENMEKHSPTRTALKLKHFIDEAKWPKHEQPSPRKIVNFINSDEVDMESFNENHFNSPNAGQDHRSLPDGVLPNNNNNKRQNGYSKSTTTTTTDAKEINEFFEKLPTVYLLHGTQDKSIPFVSSIDYGTALRRVGIKTIVKCFFGKNHTMPVLEDMLWSSHLTEGDAIVDVARICLEMPLFHAQTNEEESPVFVPDEWSTRGYLRPTELHYVPKKPFVIENPNYIGAHPFQRTIRVFASKVNPW